MNGGHTHQFSAILEFEKAGDVSHELFGINSFSSTLNTGDNLVVEILLQFRGADFIYRETLHHGTAANDFFKVARRNFWPKVL